MSQAQDPPSVCILTTSYPSFRPDEAEFPRGKFVHDMARFLVRSGVSVDVLTHADRGTPLDSVVDAVRVHRYSVPGIRLLTEGGGLPENVRSPRKRLVLPLYFTALLWKGLRELRSNGNSIINAHWAFPTGFIGLALKIALRRRLLITIYGAEVYPFRHGHWPWLKPLVGWVIRKADWAVAISPAAADAAKSVSRRPDICVIPDGIDVEYYAPGPRDASVAAKYGVGGRRFLFFTGRMVERKGHRFLVEAMSVLRTHLPDICALLGGDGPLMEPIRRRADELGLGSRVLFPGTIPERDLVPLLRTCDLYVLPSCIDAKGDTEGSATAALEAMACGAVALVSDVGGNSGSVIDGHGAFYFRPADPQDLADKVREVLSRSDLHEQRHIGRDYVVSRCSWKESIAGYLRLIDARNCKEDRCPSPTVYP